MHSTNQTIVRFEASDNYARPGSTAGDTLSPATHEVLGLLSALDTAY